MNPLLRSAAVAVCVVAGVCAAKPAQAQTKATLAMPVFETTWHLVQVEYRVASRPYGGRGGYGGYGYGGYGYRSIWYTVAETTDAGEAEFIYDLYQLAAETGVLSEVAPDFGSSWTPVRVRMITEQRPYEPAAEMFLR